MIMILTVNVFDYFITSEAQKVADTIQVKIFAKYGVRKIEQRSNNTVCGISMEFSKIPWIFSKGPWNFKNFMEFSLKELNFSKVPWNFQKFQFEGIQDSMEFLKISWNF